MGALAKGTSGLPAQVRAVLTGQAISLDEVGQHHCHDLDFPVYRCFDTEAERDADALGFGAGELESASSPQDALVQPLGSTSFTYVLAYAAINYGGASILISEPTPDLGAIGWNNSISSFKSTNGGRPKWWALTFYAGQAWQWGTSAWVPYVGDDANDQFSSVKNVP